MSPKVKSSLYFANLVAALTIYYNLGNLYNSKNIELAENSIEETVKNK
jgi:hypothetical protein